MYVKCDICLLLIVFRPRKKNCVFPVTRPYLAFRADPNFSFLNFFFFNDRNVCYRHFWRHWFDILATRFFAHAFKRNRDCARAATYKMASHAGSETAIIILTECVYHKTKPSRQFYIVKPNHTFFDIEREFACTDSSRLSVELASSEDGQWTLVQDTDEMYGQTLCPLLKPFGCKFIRLCCTTEPDVMDTELDKGACSTCRPSTKSAFDILMSTQKRKSLPPIKTSR